MQPQPNGRSDETSRRDSTLAALFLLSALKGAVPWRQKGVVSPRLWAGGVAR
ncbi:unnamed protein product [Effrenium voratum]|uniref:Uncharacterized protein n=1 Tax=Effrenium voratum TaxID=2562239 RepID=A0AA36NH68_9DINO|nr:unnamed protein product [Effrenium voratum]